MFDVYIIYKKKSCIFVACFYDFYYIKICPLINTNVNGNS